MLKIYIPDNNIKERAYIIDILLDEFLGLEYMLEIADIVNYEIVLENSHRLIVEDHFFSNFTNEHEYLKFQNIPNNIDFIKNAFIPEDDIPVVFGNDVFEINEDKVICGIDIFSSSFFMLTRWEEYVNKKRDKYDRFPSSESLAVKNGFANRAIVNEYVEMLWKILKYLQIDQLRKEREYQVYVTHDIDHLKKWDGVKDILKTMAGDIIKRKSIRDCVSNLLYSLCVLMKIKNDPWDTFDFIIDTSKELGVKSIFYVMGMTRGENDSRYDVIDSEKLKELVAKIIANGFTIGMHPGMTTYNDKARFFEELSRIKTTFTIEINEARQHYLKFSVPHTWQIMSALGLQTDSTLGYVDLPGFRTGVCYEYRVFDILARKKLDLKERPMLIMEHTIMENPNESITFYSSVVKKYRGDFVILWHNSSFNLYMYKNIAKQYKAMMKNAL